MRIYEVNVLANGDASGNLTSSAFQLTQMFGAAASCVVAGAGTAAGTLTMQASIDGVNFTPLLINGSPMTLAVNGNGTYIFDVYETQVQFLQVTYAATGGAGTLNITVYSKGF
jgi:hypothetical protein